MELQANISEDAELSKRFNTSQFLFGDDIKESDSLSFTENQTNIAQAITQVNTVFNTTNNAVVLLSDGNQNIGADFEYTPKNENTKIFPVVVGDTTRYNDVNIAQLNTNRYTF